MVRSKPNLDRFGTPVDLDEADSLQAMRYLIAAGAAVPGAGPAPSPSPMSPGLSRPSRSTTRDVASWLDRSVRPRSTGIADGVAGVPDANDRLRAPRYSPPQPMLD